MAYVNTRLEGMRSYRSGILGEQFCKETFGISEPRYEIKSAGARNRLVIVQIHQLLNQMEKQYVVVQYSRKTRRLKKGPRKGAEVFTETVEQGYQNNKLHVAVIRGWRLVRIAIEEKLPPYCAAPHGDPYVAGKWGVYWRIPVKTLPFGENAIIEDADRYTLYAFQDDPPAWMGDAAARTIEGGLFDTREEEDEEGEELPF